MFRIRALLALIAALVLGAFPAAAATVTDNLSHKTGSHYRVSGFKPGQHLWTRLRLSTDDGWMTLRIDAVILGDIDRVSHLDFRFNFHIFGSPDSPELRLVDPPPTPDLGDSSVNWPFYVYGQKLGTFDPRLGGSYTALVSMTHAGQQIGMAGALLAGFQQDLFFFGGELRYRSTITFSPDDLDGTEVTLLAGDVAPVPLPAGGLLLATALLAVTARTRRRQGG